MKKSLTAVLEALDRYQDEWLSINDIVKLTDYAPSTVRKRVRELEEDGKVYIKLGNRGKKLLQLKEGERRRGREDQMRANLSDFLGSETSAKSSDRAQTPSKRGRTREKDSPGIGELLPEKEEKGETSSEKRILKPYKVLEEKRDKIREVVKKFTPSEVKDVISKLWEEEEEKGSSNIFKRIPLVTPLPNSSLVGEKFPPESDLPDRYITIGTDASNRKPNLLYNIAGAPVTVKIHVTAAYGIMYKYKNSNQVGKKEVKVPRHLEQSEKVTSYEGEIREERGVSKLLREICHYEVDKKIIQKSLKENENNDPILYFRDGNILPGELHPGDWLKETKAQYLSEDFNRYLSLKQSFITHENLYPFGVVKRTDKRTSVLSRIIGEIAERELDIEADKISNISESVVLTAILKAGEVTPILKKKPMTTDIDFSKRLKKRLGPLWHHYKEKIKETEILYFYMKPEKAQAIRYEFPADIVNTGKEAYSLRNRFAPLLRTLSGQMDTRYGTLKVPRPIHYAHKEAKDWRKHLETVIKDSIKGAQGGE